MAQIVTFDVNRFAEKGERIFQKVGPELVTLHQGKSMAIEVDSGDYFLGADSHEAIRKAKQKYPGKIFYLCKVGFRAYRKQR